MKKIQIEDLMTFKHLGKLSSNPQASRAIVLASKANQKDNAYHHTLYEVTPKGMKKHLDLKKDSTAFWLSENTVLVAHEKTKTDKTKKKNQYTVFYEYDLDAESFKKRFIFPVKPTFHGRIKNTLIVTYKISSDALGLLDEKDRKATQEALKIQKPYEDIDEMPYYFNGAGFTANQRTVLATYDLSSETLTPITSLEFSVENVVCDELRGLIYYTGKPHENLRLMKSNLYQYDLKSKSHEPLDDSMTYSMKDLFLVDESLIVAASPMDEYGMNQNPDFYLVSLKGLELITPFRLSLSNTVGTDVRFLGSKKWTVLNGVLYFVMTNDDHSEIYQLNPSGELTPYYVMNGSIDGLVTLNDSLYMIAMEGMRLQEIYRLENDALKKLSRFNDRVLKDKYLATPEEVPVDKSTHTVKGWVLKPENYNGEKVPAILDIHGGPKTVYAPVYYHEMQVWASEGYLVMYANPRGSDGKGNAFSDIRGKYGTIDYEDLMDFVDEVMTNYNVDPERLYVTGGSYGGFMTNWMVGHTDRFKAAVTQRSISNWVSFYGTSDIGYFFAADQTAGHPLKDFEKIWEQSPLKYAMNIQTPLLFIHADKDYRCPIEQAQQLHAVLMNEGVDTKLVWFKDETHELSRSGKPEARMKRLTDISEWFRRYA